MTKTILTNEQKRIIKVGVAIILVFVVISTLRGCNAQKEAKETLAKAEATLAEAKQVFAEAEETLKKAEKIDAEADKKLQEAEKALAEADKKLAEAEKKAEVPEKVNATAFTSDRQKEVRFYSMKDENYLKLQKMSVTEKENITVTFYIPELPNFTGCEIIRVDNQSLNSELIRYQNAQGQKLDKSTVTEDFLRNGGSVTLKGLKEKVSYKIVIYTTEGNFAAVLNCI